jgi:hypothetical protein
VPPQSVQNAAKYRMQIHADGTMTALAQENDADGDVDEEQCECGISLVLAFTDAAQQL